MRQRLFHYADNSHHQPNKLCGKTQLEPVKSLASAETVSRPLPTYADRSDFPFPAIRWREETPEIKVNRHLPLIFCSAATIITDRFAFHYSGYAKRKRVTGENCQNKKRRHFTVIYRASFCQTFAEMKAPTGE